MQYYESWWEEKRSAYLYGILAQYEKNPNHQQLFKNLQAAALKQAFIWEKKMSSQTKQTLIFKPDLRTSLVALLIRCFGGKRIHFILAAMKIRGMSLFTHYHSEHKHITVNSSSNLRAAVFGINDGLVSNLGLILGLAGASASQNVILFAGMAGMFAGAFSMAAGEYVSVRTQREVLEYQIAIEKQELEEYPEEETEELSLIYQARGVPKVQADQLSELLIQNPQTALNTLVREELGLNPEELVSPIGAMIYSFFSFAFGALIPLLPYFLTPSTNNFYLSILLTSAVLVIIGAMLSLFSNRSPIYSAFRMFFIAFIAGSVTFIFGRFFNIS